MDRKPGPAGLDRNHVDKIIASALALFFVVGFTGHLNSGTLPLMLGMTPFILAASSLLVLIRTVRDDPRHLLLWTAGTYLFTFAAETAGVATGAVFGPYHYGSTLGVKFLEVPLIIGLNWTLIVFALASIVFRFINNPLRGAILTGILAATFDWIMEPAAIALDYWTWDTLQGIPLQNYLAWFLIAAVCAFFFRLGKLKTGSNLPVYYLLIQLGFFAGLRISGL